MHNITNKSILAIILALTIIVAGCAGRKANPIRAYKSTDEGMNCSEIKAEMSYVDSQISSLIPETEKTGKNTVLGVTGWFLIVPWFFMDLSDSEQHEVKAFQQRYMELDKQYAKRRCGTRSQNKTPENQVPVSANEDKMKTAAQRLESLSKLKEGGLISEEEYKQKRIDILNDIQGWLDDRQTKGVTEMKLFSLLTLLLSIVALNGCSTTYQASGFTGGYTETWLAEDVVRVEFTGNGYTSASKATDLSMLRIAELAGKKGYNHFIFISSENQVESSTTAPTRIQNSWI